jgi:hypothetical protein
MPKMIRVWPALLVGVVAASLGAPGLAQSMLGNAAPYAPGNDDSVIAVPPAPPVVAAPPTPLAPDVPPSAAPPPGLVPASPPVYGPDMGNDTGGTAVSPGQPAPQPGLSQATPGPAPEAAGQEAGVGTAPGSPASPQDQDVIPTPPNNWEPRKDARLGVLDEVGGGVQEITVPVGGQAMVGNLQVTVQSCLVRPADQVPDAAVYLSLQNSKTPSEAGYRGWLVRSVPGASMAADASQIFRVIGCS